MTVLDVIKDELAKDELELQRQEIKADLTQLVSDMNEFAIRLEELLCEMDSLTNDEFDNRMAELIEVYADRHIVIE